MVVGSTALGIYGRGYGTPVMFFPSKYFLFPFACQNKEIKIFVFFPRLALLNSIFILGTALEGY